MTMRRDRVQLTIVAAAVLAVALTAPAAASAHERSRLAVNLALAGSASADGGPAAQAIDGSASTSWCSDAAPARLRVDLRRVRWLSGLGLTLAAGSATSPLRLDVSPDGRHWWPAAQNVNAPAGEPTYVALPHLTRLVRFVRLTASPAGVRRRAARVRARRVGR